MKFQYFLALNFANSLARSASPHSLICVVSTLIGVCVASKSYLCLYKCSDVCGTLPTLHVFSNSNSDSNSKNDSEQ